MSQAGHPRVVALALNGLGLRAGVADTALVADLFIADLVALRLYPS